MATPDGLGYWLATSNGSVYSFGDARYYGPRSPLVLSGPVVGMAATPEGGGYWLVTANGSIYSFGNATFHGSAQGHGQIVGVAASPAGPGYYVTNSEGAVFWLGARPPATPPGYRGPARSWLWPRPEALSYRARQRTEARMFGDQQLRNPCRLGGGGANVADAGRDNTSRIESPEQPGELRHSLVPPPSGPVLGERP